MPVRPEDIQNKKFKIVKGRKEGYDEDEVDAFLDDVEAEMRRIVAENESLRQRLEAALNAPPPAPVASEAEEMLRRTLLLAQRTADETVAAAQADAERMTTEARQTATTLVESARAQAAAATVDLERRRQALEQHIEGLRAFEREYRTRLKAYLESQLRDLEGRGAPADPPPAVGGGAPAVAAPPAAPAVASAPPAPPVAAPPTPPAPVAPPPAPPVPPVAGVVSGASGPSSIPAPAPDPSAFEDVYGDPEPFDVDGGGTDVPRLAP